jgi:outer membrane protein insertion porin family
MVLATGEYRFPMSVLPLLHSLKGIQGIVFADAGDAESFGTSPTNFKTDVGFGLAAKTPIGLFRIDFGFGAEGSQLWISTGTTF